MLCGCRNCFWHNYFVLFFFACAITGNTFPDLVPPGHKVIYDTLGKLIRDRKVIFPFPLLREVRSGVVWRVFTASGSAWNAASLIARSADKPALVNLTEFVSVSLIPRQPFKIALLLILSLSLSPKFLFPFFIMKLSHGDLSRKWCIDLFFFSLSLSLSPYTKVKSQTLVVTGAM